LLTYEELCYELRKHVGTFPGMFVNQPSRGFN